MSKISLYDAGRFNRQLSIQNLVDISDGCGGYLQQYEVQGSVWAHVCPISARSNLEADKSSQTITHHITCRFQPQISLATRFTTGSRNFDVVTVYDPDETRRYLKCEVIER